MRLKPVYAADIGNWLAVNDTLKIKQKLSCENTGYECKLIVKKVSKYD
jgi:hypothetical protein